VVADEQITTTKNKVLKCERRLKNTYFNEVGLRVGKEKWRFVKDFNRLVSGEEKFFFRCSYLSTEGCRLLKGGRMSWGGFFFSLAQGE
jgi:hypothetical protein